jgi:hypothetical protein
MMRRLARALRVALRDEDFGRVLAAGFVLIVIGTLAYSLGAGWNLVDSLYAGGATIPRRLPLAGRPELAWAALPAAHSL